MLNNVFNFLLITGVIQGFAFNIVTLSFLNKKKISKAILYLNLIVLSISLNNLQACLIAKGYTSSWYIIKHLEIPWYLFIVPMFYSFLIYFLIIENKYQKIVTLTLSIFIVEVIIRLLLISYGYTTNSGSAIIKNYTRIEEVVNALIAIIIFIKSYKIIFTEQYNYPFALSFDDMKWLKQFIVLGCIILSFWIFAIVLNYVSEIPTNAMYYPLRLGSSLLLYWISYQGFLRYSVMTDRIKLRKVITKNIQHPETYKTPKIKSQSDLFETICKHIQDHKLFFNHNLTLDALAIDLGISSSRLSKIINKHPDINFTDLINEFRIEHAKSLLLDSNFDNYTVISIGLESGFNSKSTFYKAFKKFTSLTPTEFKKKQQKRAKQDVSLS